MFDKRGYAIVTVLGSLILYQAWASEPTFTGGSTFKGSSLKGWHVLGQADWTAQNGELTGKAKDGGSGWLVLDQGLQDIGFFASFKCTGACKTGVLVRAEKTPQGMKGIYVSLTEGELGSYKVTLDAEGHELSREALGRGAGGSGSMTRFMVVTAPTAAGGGGRGAAAGRGGPGGPGGGGRGGTPLKPFDPQEWTQFEVLIDGNVAKANLVGVAGSLGGGLAPDDIGKYGPVALFIGGTGEVTFKDIKYRDLAMITAPVAKASPNFRVQQISDMYYSWSSAAADFNRDGIMDIVSGPYIYYGPTYTKFREIYPAVALSPTKDFTDVNCQYAFDWNGDGWPDVLVGASARKLYINPKGESRRWDSYQVIPAMSSEASAVFDIDNDGKPELIYAAGRSVRYAKPDPADVAKPWKEIVVSETGGGAHGIGAGDINGDGRPDILTAQGWWEQPATDAEKGNWKFHQFDFGGGLGGGDDMFVWDVNGDGLADVVTALSAHRFGLAWFEQKKVDGEITFVEHQFAGDAGFKNAGGITFSEPHATGMGDINGDGIPDFVVGKRVFSHLDSDLDPDPRGLPVLIVYKTVRNPKAPGGAEFVPEVIYNRAGAGSSILVVDLNKDGAAEIVTATNRGAFIFWNKQVPAKKTLTKAQPAAGTAAQHAKK
jgi:hypothetical protein